MFTHPTILALLADARRQSDFNPRRFAAWRDGRPLRRDISGGRPAVAPSPTGTPERRPT
jgi:hypothetical protein